MAQPAPRVTEPPPAPPAPATALHEGPLTDFVPAASLLWLVVGRPRQIATDPTLSAAVRGLLSADRLAAFAARTGVELDQTEAAAAAGYPLGTLYLATSDTTARVERAFRTRLVAEPLTRRPHPAIHSMTAIRNAQPYTLVTVRDRFIAVSVGDPQPARAALGFALGRLKSPAVMDGAALSTLDPPRGEVPLAFYAAGPFSGEWVNGARGLLGMATALSLSATPQPPHGLRLELVLAGGFPEAAHAEERVLGAWADLVDSPLGRLLGCDEPRAGPTATATPERVSLEVELALDPLVAGLRAAVMADVDELLGPPVEPMEGPTEVE